MIFDSMHRPRAGGALIAMGIRESESREEFHILRENIEILKENLTFLQGINQGILAPEKHPRIDGDKGESDPWSPCPARRTSRPIDGHRWLVGDTSRF
jgi:hypothetical protein